MTKIQSGFTQVAYCMEKIFFKAFCSIAKQRYKWYVTKSVYMAMTVFVTSWKKKEQEILCSRMWAWIFLC